MGAARICPRCLVRLVTNVTHTRVWCPVCKRQLRLVNHGEESACRHSPRQPAAAHRTRTPSSPPRLPRRPPYAGSAAQAERPGAPIIAPPVRGPRTRGAVPTLFFLFLVALIGCGAGLAFYLLIGPRQDGGSARAAAQPAPVAAKAPAPEPAPEPVTPPRPPKPKARQRPPTPASPPPYSLEAVQAENRREVLEQRDTAPAAGANVPEGSRRIDELVLARLQEKAIRPSAPCSDAVFVRRVYLDVIGLIPTAEQAKQFLQDKSPDRREALIDQLLAHPDFADYWAMRWCDLLRVKSEFPINLWPNAVQAYHRWIRDAVRENMPYDRFARALLTASGSNFRDPPANFYRAVQKKDPPTIAKAVALTFMGVRPEGWPKDRWEGMEPFFSQVGYKKTGEWKEEVVFFDVTKPLKPGTAVFPDGTAATVGADQDPREVFADWLISPKNEWFTRNIANRAWAWLLGRGVIQEPDDIRPDNPPSNPELLAFLEEDLIRSNYDLRSLFRVILNSGAYQASSLPASDDPEAAALFAYYPVRRLEAEVLIDAICQVTGTTERYSSPIPEPFTYIPESRRTVALADASITSPFLDTFGRAARDTGLESEQNNNFTTARRLYLLNSAHIRKKIDEGPAVQQLLRGSGGPKEVVGSSRVDLQACKLEYSIVSPK